MKKSKIEIYKSDSLEILLDTEAALNEPQIIINNYGKTDQDIICELKDELKKPYVFKFDWILIIVLIVGFINIPFAIYYKYNWFAIIYSILILAFVWDSDYAQKFHFIVKNKILSYLISYLILCLSNNEKN